MHLLQLHGADSFSLVEYFGDSLPEYAILLHTWGQNGDEVTYQDLLNNTAREKKGYDKLVFCGKQASLDNLQHFWIDTCCINKQSSAELSEAINSMFRWYQKASRCYVYLSDVLLQCQDSVENGQGYWKQAFRNSRWFTRMWTLQELLAPRAVEFFSANHKWLGNRERLLEEIVGITGIPAGVLREQHTIFDFDINERMAWASNREAKREEDYAYSLLGICDVSMPLVYGEGRQKAFKRLRRAIRESGEDESGNSYRHSIHPSAKKGTQFTAYGGTQYNNTGSGIQLSGDFTGPINLR